MRNTVKKPDPTFLMLDPRQIKKFGGDYSGFQNLKRITPFRASISKSEIYRRVFKSKNNGKSHIGNFFETLVYLIQGGIINKQLELKTLGGNHKALVTPDLMDINNCVATEVRGVSLGHGLRISDEKIRSYILLQLSQGIFQKTPRIYFDIFRYGEYGRGKDKGLESRLDSKVLEEKIHFLSNNIRYQLSLPFSLLFNIYLSPMWLKEGNPKKQKVFRYEDNYNKSHNACTLYSETDIKPSALNHLFLNPRGFLEEIKINSYDYNLIYARSPDILINRRKINNFPVLMIQEKSPRHIFSNFLRLIVEDKEKIFPNLYDELHGIDNHLIPKNNHYYIKPIERKEDVILNEKGYPIFWD